MSLFMKKTKHGILLRASLEIFGKGWLMPADRGPVPVRFRHRQNRTGMTDEEIRQWLADNPIDEELLIQRLQNAVHNCRSQRRAAKAAPIR